MMSVTEFFFLYTFFKYICLIEHALLLYLRGMFRFLKKRKLIKLLSLLFTLSITRKKKLQKISEILNTWKETRYAPVPFTTGRIGSNRLTKPRLFILNWTQSNRMTPNRTGYHPTGLGPSQNEQSWFSESIGTSSTGWPRWTLYQSVWIPVRLVLSELVLVYN
jgi:hypothetical protein